MRCLFCFFIFTPILVILLVDADNCNMPLDMYMNLFEKEYKMHWSCSGLHDLSTGGSYLHYAFKMAYLPEDKVGAFMTLHRILAEILMYAPNIEPTILLYDPMLDTTNHSLSLWFHYPDFTIALKPDLGGLKCLQDKVKLIYFKLNEEKLDVYREEEESNYDDFIISIGFDKNTPFQLSDLEGHVADVRP